VPGPNGEAVLADSYFGGAPGSRQAPTTGLLPGAQTAPIAFSGATGGLTATPADRIAANPGVTPQTPGFAAPTITDRQPAAPTAPAAGAGGLTINSAAQRTGATPFSLAEAMQFLTQAQRDLLQRLGITSAQDVAPIKFAAPGTSGYERDVGASALSALGFGPASLAYEEISRLVPKGVAGGGVARRTR
jgi:hypothetical protein